MCTDTLKISLGYAVRNSQKLLQRDFQKPLKRFSLTITKRDRNHDRSYSCCFQVMRSDSRTTRRKNRYHEFVTYLEALSKCTAWTSDWVNQNPPQHVPIMPRTTEKNFDDFVTYPKALSNCIAWTSAWVNQKGYVTCSYNVKHDGKITITIFCDIQSNLYKRSPSGMSQPRLTA